MLEGDSVAPGPLSIDGLLGDEAMPPAPRVLVVSVHPALSHVALLEVVVGNNTVVGAAIGRQRFQDLHRKVWIRMFTSQSFKPPAHTMPRYT